MKVTIITVTYNASKYLDDCINSVIRQDYNDIEHIVIDGCSKDNTIDIIKKYESHIAKWISEKDNGMYDAINKGMKMATGEVIGILNSDDVLASEDVITKIAETFKTSKVDCVYGDLTYVDPQNTDKILRFWKGGKYNRNRFLYGWMPAHPTFYIRKEVVEKYGGYESHYFTAADYEFMARYLYRHRISAFYLEKLIVRMRTGGISNASLGRRIRANRRDYLAMRTNRIPFPFIASVLKPLIKVHQYYYTFTHRP
ncbi:glycosyltransferase family 2 protein [Ferruginibacter albus]|uniref:glycosyltransferase family 2 protein n=1 Tax=Ferruginibacter albus TaxID=2875540 RepID=UPI001CC4A1DD|nr:glycosyltransferase family 2 protein [Ferruginibacter albus]UAY50668.1 glycosyltransferase [Ferruginibacter albus]